MMKRLAFVVLLAGWSPFRADNADVEAGNRAYADGRWDDAIAAYDRAAKDPSVDPAGLAFDRGSAELAKAKAAKDDQGIAKAMEDLKAAQRSTDPKVRSAANYNRGNAL